MTFPQPADHERLAAQVCSVLPGAADWLDRRVWGGVVALTVWLFGLWAKLNKFLDERIVNGGFDKSCDEIAAGGGLAASVQTGRVQAYLRLLALAVVVLAAILIWSSAR